MGPRRQGIETGVLVGYGKGICLHSDGVPGELNKNPGICDHEPALCVTAMESLYLHWLHDLC